MLNLQPINELVAQVNEATERRRVEVLQYLEKDRADTIARIEGNRYILPQLVEVVGVESVEVPSWCRGREVIIDLGSKPSKREKKARAAFDAKLVALRSVLGNLEERGKSIVDASKRLVRVTLKGKDYPGVEIHFVCRLPAGEKAKCKLVKKRVPAHTEVELVCQV